MTRLRLLTISLAAALAFCANARAADRSAASAVAD
jgi:hypothetical protein